MKVFKDSEEDFQINHDVLQKITQDNFRRIHENLQKTKENVRRFDEHSQNVGGTYQKTS